MFYTAQNLTHNGLSGKPFRFATIVPRVHQNTDERNDDDGMSNTVDANVTSGASADGPAPGLTKLPPSRIISGTSLRPHIDRARTWIDHCLARHDSCRKLPHFARIYGGDACHYVVQHAQNSVGALPRRLLQISGDNTVKLVEFEVMSQEEAHDAWEGLPPGPRDGVLPSDKATADLEAAPTEIDAAQDNSDAQTNSLHNDDPPDLNVEANVMPPDEAAEALGGLTLDEDMEAGDRTHHANIHYVALSHRWGKDEHCKTLGANLEELKSTGLAITDLPRTFHDAVIFTLGLGLEYIWIDSLCIVQDSKEDWKDEAPRMASIYGNSVCTISALDAEDSDGGLFIEKSTSLRGLDSRAWVTQERMIPPRSLLFTDNSVHWECRQSCDDTSQPHPALPLSLRVPSDPSFHPKALYAFFRDFQYKDFEIVHASPYTMLLLSDVVESCGLYDLLPFLRNWWQFIMVYTQCHLTKASDKFMAIGGIANTVLFSLHLPSYFGLWGHPQIFLMELAWYVDPAGEEGERALTEDRSPLAPSWTWASLSKGRVRNDVYFRRPFPPWLPMKPWYEEPPSTSFEHELPYAVWTTLESNGLQLKAHLREMTITRTSDLDEETSRSCYQVQMDPSGCWSYHERHTFHPDEAAEFPINRSMRLFALHILHHPSTHEMPESDSTETTDIFLALQVLEPRIGTMGNEDPTQEPWATFDFECHVPGASANGQDFVRFPSPFFDPQRAESESILNNGRTFRRLGLIETKYAGHEVRPGLEIQPETKWKYLRIV